jgi:hypothetical protein
MPPLAGGQAVDMTVRARLGSLGLIGGLLILALVAGGWLIGQPAQRAGQAPMPSTSETAQDAEHLAAQLARQPSLGLALLVTVAGLCGLAALVVRRRLQAHAEQLQALAERHERLEAALREAELALQTRRDALAQFSQAARTPFQSLLGLLSLLRQAALTPHQTDHLRLATEAADYLLVMLSDLADLNQLDDGQQALEPVPLELRALLRQVEALIRPQAEAKSVALRLDAEPAVPAWILADRARLKQLLFRLLGQAVQVCAHGRVSLDVRLNAGDTGRLVFVITGTVGDPSAMPRHPTCPQGTNGPATRDSSSEGLGPDSADRLARSLGGSVHAFNAPGGGHRVHFELPLQAAEPAAAPWPPAIDTAASLRPLTVLVAEDHPVNREYLASLLKTLQHEAHFVANGLQAVAAVQQRRFDLVLMDLHMPELDGIGATTAIRTLPDRAAATVPIVALTADTFQETRERCRLAGMNEFLSKPVSPQDLAAAMRRLFGQAAAAAALIQRPAADAAPVLPDDIVLMDHTAVQAAPGGSPAQLARQRLDYLARAPQTVAQLREAVRDGQPSALRGHAQACALEARQLGLSGLAQAAQALHDGAVHLPAHEIAHLVQRFDALLPRTRAAVEAQDLGRRGEA